ncbi:MAG: exonuclease domain-containing protein, partial [Chloroflexota bacterium]|nr:exonuclease domain-containing protein [Chloroflexota bacterium]
MIDLPLVSLDLEMLDAEGGSEIVEVGAVKFRGRETLGTFSALVRPRGTPTFHLGELTGLTAADLRDAEDLGVVLGRLSAFIGGAPLVGQSIGIDVENLRRAGLALRNPQLDTFELAILLRPGLRSYDLLSIARDLGVTGGLAHRALSDALLARDVFLKLVERAGALGIDALSQIVRLAGPLDWPLKLVFAEAQRARVRELMQRGAADVGAGRGPLGDLPPPPAVEPLDERPRFVSLDVDALVHSIRPGGAVAEALPGFEERPEQQRMLAAVVEAFNAGDTLLVEAGTGTGKSLAYLLPALHFAVANGRRVVVSTNTINLQDQLRDKDVPDLLRATGQAATVTTLKGRTNYLCLRRWQTLLQTDDLSPAERMLLIRTLLWLPVTCTGDRAELRLGGGEDEAWGKLAAVAEVCSPLRCPYHRAGACFVARARRAAEGAHVIIVNHALLLLDAVGANQVLPEYRHLVVDEAHHLEDEATSQLSERVTQREMQRRLDELLEGSAVTESGLLADASAALHRAHAEEDRREQARALFER